MLRQAENNVKIEGILSEIDLKYGSYVKNGNTIDTIGGSIKVLVEQVINDKEVTLEIPVYMFSGKLTNAGKPNPAYASIEKVMKEFVSIAACGSKEQASKVRITNGTIRMNEFYGQGGVLISQPRINASFVSHAIGEFKPEATYSLEFMVSDIQRVVDKDGVEVDPPKTEVTVIVPGYNGAVDVVKLHAASPNVINAIESYWEPGNCYKASGRLNFSSITQTIKEDVDFGEAVEKTRTINISEFVITGGTQTPLDEDLAFDVEEIKKAMAERKLKLEERKNTAKRAPAPSPAKGKLDLGF